MTQKERLLKQYSDWLQMRNYSLQTYKAYLGTIRAFWHYCESKEKDATFEKANAVQSYLAHRLTVQKRDYSTVNGDYAALMWFYKNVLNREWDLKKLKRPKKEKRLPRYITPHQVSSLLSAVSCEKHRLLMLLYYGTGMRLSEARLLLWEDVNFEEGIIWVKKGKGAKDRLVIL
ncbi:MAG: tyrosine-type recombinase/integrase, partial [Saprospiraceae bacterium]